MSKIKQSDFMQAHGIKQPEIKAIRDEHIAPEDWWKEGVAIYWRKSAADALEAKMNSTKPAPSFETLSVRVIQPAKNPRFVYADLNGNRIAVAVPQKLSSRLQGKMINVAALDMNGGITYTYQP